MTGRLILTLGAAAGALAFAATASAAPAAYKPARNAWGQPDLGGFWSNVSLTPEQRPAALGAKAAYSPDEVKKIESAVTKEIEDGNESVDPNAPAPKQGGETKVGVRPEFAAAGGGVGGYDRGWLDPGSHVMRVKGEARTSVLTTPDGRVPKSKPGVTSPASGRGGAGGLGSFDNPEQRSLGDRCIMGFGRNAGPPMLANGFYNNNYHIVQGKDEVGIVIEMVHDVRHIRLSSAHRTDGLRPWMGDSIGRYEGDTLVVETTNIPERQAYYGAWKDLKVTERLTRTGPYKLHYAFTVEDPTRWDKPWGGEYEFNPLDGVIFEYACHEGNHALPGMLAGAREQEKQAAKARAEGPATALPGKGG